MITLLGSIELSILHPKTCFLLYGGKKSPLSLQGAFLCRGDQRQSVLCCGDDLGHTVGVLSECKLGRCVSGLEREWGGVSLAGGFASDEASSAYSNPKIKTLVTGVTETLSLRTWAQCAQVGLSGEVLGSDWDRLGGIHIS